MQIERPEGAHAIAVGLNAPIEVTINGSTGYYCAGMNKHATIKVNGSVGPGVAENMMSGRVVVEETQVNMPVQRVMVVVLSSGATLHPAVGYR